MRYRVHGVNRATGVETSVVLEADDPQTAEAIAQGSLIVAEVEPEGPNGNAVADDESVVLAQAARDGRRQEVRKILHAPEYKAITTGAAVLRSLSFWCYVCFGAAVLGLVLAIVQYVSNRDVSMLPLAGMCFGAAFSSLIAGAVLGMLASLGLAVRDIARNSYAK